MLEVYTLFDKKWLEIVESFKDVDVYHLPNYLLPLDNYTKNETKLFYYTSKIGKVALIMTVCDIAKDEKFKSKLEKNQYYDMETPYGYGGALVENYNEELMLDFSKCLSSYAKENKIISQFIRFNPLTENSKLMQKVSNVKIEKHTIFIDLQSFEIMNANMDSKNRNMVRKAIKNEVVIKIMNDENFAQVTEQFKLMYKETMHRNNAEEFYYFDNNYFDEFFNNFKKHYKLFYAMYDNKIISMAIIMHGNENLHYHLSAADREYIHLAPNNLLLFEVAKWGIANGMKKFHLGGGVSDNDRLFSFKKSFNKNKVLDFCIGSNIFDIEKYNELVKIRKEIDCDFDLERPYMIKYRQ